MRFQSRNYLVFNPLSFSVAVFQREARSFKYVYISVATMVMKMIHTGLSPVSQIRSAAAMGIRAVSQVIFAVRAIFSSGAAISATTAGRTPLNTASTAGWSL